MTSLIHYRFRNQTSDQFRSIMITGSGETVNVLTRHIMTENHFKEGRGEVRLYHFVENENLKFSELEFLDGNAFVPKHSILIAVRIPPTGIPKEESVTIASMEETYRLREEFRLEMDKKRKAEEEFRLERNKKRKAEEDSNTSTTYSRKLRHISQ